MVYSREPVLRDAVTDTWCAGSWEDFLALADAPAYERGRFYYHQGYMRVEMAAVGPRHGRLNSIVSYLVVLFAALNNIPIVQFVNTSFRKAGLQEFQPDLAFYIGSGLRVPPESNSPVDLNECDPPTLVVEVGATSISDDLGRKRLLYERAGVREYWVVDTNAREAIAFEISQGRSGEIQESLVLPGLWIALVEEALTRSQTQDDGEINRWLLQTFMGN
ncbi:Uma2 family endonuclease [Kamptonema formosum]|uniref:Uma2 family endonuclease n=1 Tax=Kamptonema formosum TaxID=331992 RepID=UPI00034BCD6B|nr:Uma2 family endonuclease [Oscillatoria sp. PCC 10802]